MFIVKSRYWTDISLETVPPTFYMIVCTALNLTWSTHQCIGLLLHQSCSHRNVVVVCILFHSSHCSPTSVPSPIRLFFHLPFSASFLFVYLRLFHLFSSQKNFCISPKMHRIFKSSFSPWERVSVCIIFLNGFLSLANKNCKLFWTVEVQINWHKMNNETETKW